MKQYTTISIPVEVKDKFLKLNVDWNMRNKKERKTKEEFFELVLNRFEENLK